MVDCNSQLKIVFVCNVDWFFISHRLPLAKEALAKGNKVYVLTKNTGRRKELEAFGLKFIEIPFIRSGKNPIHEINCILKLCKSYKDIQPDIIHHITLKSALLGSVASKIAKVKNVVNAISGLGYNFTDGRNGLLQKVIKKLINVAFKSRYFHFILQNPDDFQMIENLSLVPNKHIHLIKGSGVNLNTYKFNPLSLDGKIKFLFPARLLYDKGLMELIGAAKKLQSSLEGKAQFLLAGDCDPDNLAAISEEELQKELIPGYIDWIGFQKDMYPIYVNSHIVILPSYREGLPKSLIEACAVGRPIITTDVPGCRECVINNLNGCLVKVKDIDALSKAIYHLFCHPELLSEMGKESRLLAEREFSIDVVVDKTFDIYNSLIRRNNNG